MRSQVPVIAGPCKRSALSTRHFLRLRDSSNLRVGGITVIPAESETLTRASEETLGLSIQDTTCLRVADERDNPN